MTHAFDQADHDRLAALTAPAFEDLIGHELRVAPPPAVRLRVVAVHDASRTPDERAFDVVLSGPAQPRLSQGIHPVHHPDVGWLPLFLVPGAPDEATGSPTYVASFG